MSESIQIASTSLPIVEHLGRRVVTLAMVDEVHQRPTGTAGRNFRANRERFIEGEDYFRVGSDEIRRTSTVATSGRDDNTLLTESGYLMLVKSFADDLAWQVQRALVKSYFRAAPPPSEDLRALRAEIGTLTGEVEALRDCLLHTCLIPPSLTATIPPSTAQAIPYAAGLLAAAKYPGDQAAQRREVRRLEQSLRGDIGYKGPWQECPFRASPAIARRILDWDEDARRMREHARRGLQRQLDLLGKGGAR